MVDLETTGTAPGCSPVSIGAVAFDQVAGDLTYAYLRKILGEAELGGQLG